MREHGEFNYWDTPLLERFEQALGKKERSVTTINDHALNFDEVKNMFCQGIHRALEAEAKEEASTDAVTNKD